MGLVLDCETVGTNHHAPDFEILFNGWMDEKTGEVYQGKHCFPQDVIDGPIIGYNIKFDYKCLLKERPEYTKHDWDFYDTQIALHLLRPDLNSYKLEDLSSIFYDKPNYKGLVEFKDNQHTEDIGVLKLYNYHDLRFTKQLKDLTEPMLKANNQMGLFRMMMDFVKALSHAEMKGVGVDVLELNRQGAIFTAKENKHLEELRNYAQIDWNSPKQIRDLFLGRGFKLPRTSKGNDSVNKASLSEILVSSDSEARAIAQSILEYRKAFKQRATYVDGFKSLLVNDIYYPDYFLLLVTGRMSEHFIQVMPRKTVSDFKRCIVSKFIDGELLEIDWGQLELRLNAEESGDKNLIKDLLGGFDLHAETLARFPFLPDRTRAKNVNFSVFFGGKGYTLVHEYGLTEQQAKDIRHDLIEVRYPGMQDYFSKAEYQMLTRGYVVSFYGRRGYTNKFTEAYNRPIQGAGSDWNKLMIITLDHALRSYESHVIADIHDAVIVDIHPKEKVEVLKIVKDCYDRFSDIFWSYFEKNLKMKYIAEYKIGKNLYDMKGL